MVEALASMGMDMEMEMELVQQTTMLQSLPWSNVLCRGYENSRSEVGGSVGDVGVGGGACELCVFLLWTVLVHRHKYIPYLSLWHFVCFVLFCFVLFVLFCFVLFCFVAHTSLSTTNAQNTTPTQPAVGRSHTRVHRSMLVH